MPIARVQMPDGTIARLEVPAGTTPTQIEAFILEMTKGAASAPAQEKPNALERLGRGFEDVRQGVVQAGLSVKDLFTGGSDADAYTRQKTDELNLYEQGRGPQAGIDWMRMGGNVLGTLPVMAIPGAGATTLPARMASGAAQGGVAAGSLFTPEGESKGAQVALGTAVGGAVPAAFYGIGRGAQRVSDMFKPNVTVNVTQPSSSPLAGEIKLALESRGLDWNKLTSEVQKSLLDDATAAASAGLKLDADALKRKALIEATGAKPTAASVTRDPKAWQTEQNLRGITGVGEPIVKRSQENAQALIDNLAKIGSQTGGRAKTAYEAGDSAIHAIKAQDAAKDDAVGALYDAFRQSGQQHAKVPHDKLTVAIGRVIDEQGIEALPQAVVNRLKEFGYLDSKMTRQLTIGEADKFNRFLNEWNPGRGPEARAIGIVKNALQQSMLDIQEAGGKEAALSLTKARAAAAQRFAEADASKGISAALDDVSPDRFVKKFIFDADVKDVRNTLAELRKTAAGNQAIADTKGHLIDTLLMKATGATNLDDALVGGRPFSGATFSKALDSIPPEKLALLFKGDELASLRTLQKASKYLTTEVPFSDVNYSKTTTALANLLQKIGSTPMLGNIVSPIIGAGKIGIDWVKDAASRKQVAEILIGSAAKPGSATAATLPLPNTLQKLLPSAAGAGAATFDE